MPELLPMKNGVLLCPYCSSDKVTKRGFNTSGTQRYICGNVDCGHTFTSVSKDIPIRVTPDARKKPREQYSFDESSNTGEITALTEIKITTLDELIEFCKIDTEIWEIERWLCNKWEMGYKIGNDSVGSLPLFQVKAWLKKRVEKLEMEDIKNEILNEIKKHAFKYPKIKYEKKKNGHLLEVDLFDLHFGKLTWDEESGHNYDIKIAEELFMSCIYDIIKKADPYPIDKVLFPIGNDFFNVDNMNETTTKGTKQQEDTRWKKTFKKGRQLIIKAIDALSTVAPVDVIVIPGNHDYERAFYLGECIDSWYHDNPNVTVDNSANVRKYFSYGSVLLGFTHGKNEKPTNLRALMPVERKELWAKSKVREWHLGDQHRKIEWFQKGTEEELGITIRFLRSLAPADSWHFENGFLGQVRAAEAFIWDKETGMVCQYYSNLKDA